ncbi:MAG: carboxypeptidase-like regulatory domain-containing protein, partial [Longimicrobiales bacterium]
MKHLRYLLMAALVAMPLTACDDDDDGDGVAPPAVGTVSGTVSAEGDGLAGVSVTLVGATSQSATTGSGGSFSFTNVEAGSYGVTISDIPSGVSFSTTAKTTSITTDGQTVTVDFSGSYIRTSTIAGQVVVDGDGIAGIAVTATGPEGTDDAVTDNGGNYSFSGLRAGDYTVAIDAPADYTFAATSYDITLGTGEAKTASFFGEMVVTEDPVTAEVIIESVKDDDGDFVDPSNVYRDIYVTLGIDPGENNLSRVCVLLDGVELPNGCQTFSSAVSDQELQTALAPTFAILTDDFDEETGVPFWFNGEHELSAKLELEGAMESSVVTSMVLTFDNDDQVLSYLTSEFAQVGGGAQWLGGILTVEILPTLYSGKELESIDWCFYFDGALSDCDDLDGPFPQTVTFDPEDTGWNFTTTDDLDSYFRVTTGLYADGSSGSFYDMALINDTDNTASNFDYEAPDWSGVFLQLPQQDPGNLLGLADEPCCSNNWVGPDFAPADGLTDIGVDAGVGIETAYFNVGTDLYTTSEVIIGTVALDGIMADAGVTQTFTNDQYEICAEAVDFFGNSSYICKTTNGNNTGDLFGFDDTAPTSQTVTAQPPMQVIYNIADAAAAGDLGGLSIAASEDRSGFSGVPFRGYMQWWIADDDAYLVATVDSDGNKVSDVNLPSSMPSCLTDGGGTPETGVKVCYPDHSSADGVFYVTGSMNNQAGVQNATMVEGWVFNDQTAPEVTSNVTVP